MSKHFDNNLVLASSPPPPPPSPIFRQTYNLITGKLEWQPKPVDYDFHQEIARSGYADMLHDVDRNILYQEAIREAVKGLVNDPTNNPNKDRHFHCLDIGTGSGLLSMMVVEAFRQQNYDNFNVTACECFLPMGGCARKVIARNNMDDKINVILKRSTNINLKEDLNYIKADLLVAELLDTELIGEGCLHIYRHALQNLCQPNCILIPQKARIYVYPVQSSWLYDRHQLRNPMTYYREDKKNQNGGDQDRFQAIVLPKEISDCSGVHSLYDLQLSELLQDFEFYQLSKPQVAFEFDFSDITTLNLFDTKALDFTLEQDVFEPMMVFMWWDLTLITEKNSYSNQDILLSCAPTWALPEVPLNKGIPTEFPIWRDHWMQAIYYFSSTVMLKSTMNQLYANDKLTIYCNHDDYSLWFDLNPHLSSVRQPISCSCGLHLRLSRDRLSMLNDSGRLSIFSEAIEVCMSRLATEKKETRVLFIGHISYLPIIIAKYKQVSLILFYDNSSDSNYTEKLYKTLASENNSVVDIKRVNFDYEDKSHLSKSIDLIVTEPYFQVVGLPWNLLHYWRILDDSGIATEGKLLVTNASIKCILMDFEYLGRIRADVGNCQGFDLKDFDLMMNSSRDYSDQSIEPQPLWEYCGRSLQSKATTLFEFDFNKSLQTFIDDNNGGNITLVKNFACNKEVMDLSNRNSNGLAISFWMDFELLRDTASTECSQRRIVTTGPISEIRENQRIEWHRDWKQGVCFLSGLNSSVANDLIENSINLRIDLNIKSGEMNVTQLIGSVVF